MCVYLGTEGVFPPTILIVILSEDYLSRQTVLYSFHFVLVIKHTTCSVVLVAVFVFEMFNPVAVGVACKGTFVFGCNMHNSAHVPPTPSIPFCYFPVPPTTLQHLDPAQQHNSTTIYCYAPFLIAHDVKQFQISIVSHFMSKFLLSKN